MSDIQGGFIELRIGGQPQASKPKYSQEDVKCAAECLLHAKEIQQDPELMGYVKAFIAKNQEYAKAIEKESKSVKPKSIQDLRDLANGMPMGENDSGDSAEMVD